MIFHKRDHHIIELQQSGKYNWMFYFSSVSIIFFHNLEHVTCIDEKAIMPDEACSLADISTMAYTTLISKQYSELIILIA